ncbi:Testis-expressed protein 11 [Mactra antiquata]
MDTEITVMLTQTRAINNEILKEDLTLNSSSVNQLDKGLKMCHSISAFQTLGPEQLQQLTELENMAVKLWNHSVALKTKGVPGVSDGTAKMRHIAFWILELCGQKNDNEANQKRLIMMGLKSIRAWLGIVFSSSISLF